MSIVTPLRFKESVLWAGTTTTEYFGHSALAPQTMKNSLDRAKLPPLIRQQLVEIEPSREGAIKYFPCDVVLKTGERVDCVYLISLADYVKLWRFYPGRGRDRGFVEVEDIA